MKYKVLQQMSHKGVMYKGGDVVELDKEDAQTIVGGFIELVDTKSTVKNVKSKSKSVISKKTK